MTCNTITKNFVLEDFVFNTVIEANAAIDMTDCKGEIDLIIDATGASDASVTVCGGDYVGKMPDMQFDIPAGSCKRISISSGETIKADGCVHLAFANYTGLKLAVLKRRYVTSH